MNSFNRVAIEFKSVFTIMMIVKKLFFISTLFFFLNSFPVFSYEENKAIWEQIDKVICTESTSLTCAKGFVHQMADESIPHIGHGWNCEKKEPNNSFIIDFKNDFYHSIEAETNRIILKKIMENAYDVDADEDMYENRILTKYDSISIVLIENEWNYFKINYFLYSKKKPLMFFDTGLCKEK